MTKQTELMLIEELSEFEMETISGGQNNNEFPGQRGLVNANVIVQDIAVDVAANVLSQRIANNQQDA